MGLLVVYLVLMIIGNFVAYGIGLVIEKNMPAASLPAFLFLYFLNLAVSWFIAVKLTEPKSKTA